MSERSHAARRWPSGKMAHRARPVRRRVPLAGSESAPLADFRDPESQRVVAAATYAVARELGRDATREYFAELIASLGSSK